MARARASKPTPIRVGCAGWSIPAKYKSSVPTTGTALQRYASVFTAVEINSSFYRPHKQATYARWGDSVPDAFRFSVKLPKTITHERHLKAVASELKTFLAECAGLGEKLGGVLVQLPPSLAFHSRSAKAFFERLRGQLAPAVEIACEPRHRSWLEEAAQNVFNTHAVNRVGADPALTAEAASPGPGGTWRYWRLHGSPQMYYSNYTATALADLARAVLATAPGITPWIMFDNTAAGHAVGNALALQHLFESQLKTGKMHA